MSSNLNLNITNLNIKIIMTTILRKTVIKTGMGNQTTKVHLFRDWTKINYTKAYLCHLVAQNVDMDQKINNTTSIHMETDTKKTK